MDGHEWVVVKDTGRLALVLERAEKGVKVVYPRAMNDPYLYANEKVRPFNPHDYPIQISSQRRKALKASGTLPMDEVEKVCNKCLTIKPVHDFAANQSRKDGSQIYRPTCIQCRMGIEGVAKNGRRADGMNVSAPLTGSYWRCPICEKDGIVGVTVKLVLDHDHLTGHAREYICDSCNTGLGRFRNGREYLSNAMRYIEKWTN